MFGCMLLEWHCIHFHVYSLLSQLESSVIVLICLQFDTQVGLTVYIVPNRMVKDCRSGFKSDQLKEYHMFITL